MEITENVLIRDKEATLGALHGLKALGVRVAMDDFGAGYSSLSYLQSFPFDKVKIDRSFTCELDQSRKSNAIVKAVASLCDGLDMAVVAEGVETEGQFEALQREGCSQAQGFLFSRPVAARELPALLQRFTGRRRWLRRSDAGRRRPTRPQRSRWANFYSISSEGFLNWQWSPQAKMCPRARPSRKQIRDRYCRASAKILAIN